MVQTSDQVVTYRPSSGEACSGERGPVEGQVTERRHIQERPVMRLLVTEDRVDVLTGPRRQHQHAGSVPSGMQAPAQDGPGVQALAVSCSQEQRLPMERLGEVCLETEGSPLTRVLLAHQLDHGDETGGRVNG